MIQLLVWKDWLRNFYRHYARILLPIVRFLLAFAVFTMINGQIGYEAKLTKLPVVLALSFFSAFMPSAVLVLLAAGAVLIHIYAASKMMTLVFLLVILILYLMFARFVPRYGWALLAVPMLYYLHIPYVSPLVLGLVATPVSALAVGCGVVIHYLLLLMKETALMATGSMGMEDVLAMYTYVLKSITGNRHMMLTIGIFFVVIFITWFVRRLRIAHAHEIAILVGVVANILLFLLGDLVLDVSDELLYVIFGSLGSGVLAFIIQFFRFTLDYSTVENVQFEDDDYYYYVRAVPKLKVTTPEVNVKKFTAGTEPESQDEYLEEDEEEEFLTGRYNVYPEDEIELNLEFEEYYDLEPELVGEKEEKKEKNRL